MLRKATKFELWSVAVAAFLMIVVLPSLNATPAGSFLHVSNFTINLYGKYLCYGLLAISVDLLWGYTGLLSLGQALFFTLGGYMMARLNRVPMVADRIAVDHFQFEVVEMDGRRVDRVLIVPVRSTARS